MKNETEANWQEHMQHCDCIADPSAFPLYGEKNSQAIGDTSLTICRCACGSNSFGGFFLRVNLTILFNGTKAKNKQGLLLDGLVRWNSRRAKETFGKPTIRSSDTDLIETSCLKKNSVTPSKLQSTKQHEGKASTNATAFKPYPINPKNIWNQKSVWQSCSTRHNVSNNSMTSRRL